MYKWVLFGHVLFVIIWMGGGVNVEALVANAKRRPDPLALGVLFRDTAGLNQRLFAVAGVFTIVFGFWLVFITSWEFEMLWVSLAILLVSFAVAADLFYTGPRSREALELIDERGPADADARTLIDQIITAGHLRMGILLVVLLLMIFKPHL
jgi:uncharacterized membrane protein